MAFDEIVSAWLAAAKAGRVTPADWQAWDDSMIQASDAPEYWTTELAVARNFDQLVAAFLHSPATVDAYGSDIGMAALGHWWQRCEKDEIALAQCLKAMAMEADTSIGDDKMESIYAILNKLEGGLGERKVIRETRRLLSDAPTLAQRQWQLVCKYKNHR